MNSDILKGSGKEIKGQIREEWGELTDDEIAQVVIAAVWDSAASPGPRPAANINDYGTRPPSAGLRRRRCER